MDGAGTSGTGTSLKKKKRLFYLAGRVLAFNFSTAFFTFNASSEGEQLKDISKGKHSCSMNYSTSLNYMDVFRWLH